MESDLELSGLCDINRLCKYWAAFIAGDESGYHMLLGYYFFCKWSAADSGIEAMRDIGMLIDVARFIVYPEIYEDAA